MRSTPFHVGNAVHSQKSHASPDGCLAGLEPPRRASASSPVFRAVNRVLIAVTLAVWAAPLGHPQATAADKAGAKEAGDKAKPFGLTKRIPWTTSRVVGTPEPPPPYTVERAFPKLKFSGPVYIAQEPGTNRFLVGELSGKIYAFTADTPDSKSRTLFLDIGRELYSFSFHPRYAENGVIFTFSPRDPKDKKKAADRLSRVSRYRATGSPRTGDPKSEEVIVEWPAGGHNGGEAIIGPDGYLYISTGDSTSGSDLKATGQGVDDLLSVMMRLDVDHPAPGKKYSIPKDNPFVNYPGARPEIWAFGFRNPWRFSFDSKTGDLWVGDVGQDLWEMIWIVQRGGNYGWSVQEGTHPFHPNKPRGPGPILPPVVEHHHSVCRSITGGYVYRGSKFPELNGVYFYGDYEYGMIWGVRAKNGRATWNRVLANTPLRIASFGVSRDGDILLLDHPSGEVYRLVRSSQKAAQQPFPRRLSETGLFASTEAHQVAPGVLPYDVNTPQWLDNATKQRFMAVPGKEKVGFVARSGNASTWRFPDGSVNLETISLEMETGNPDSRRRIETRILVKQENHWLGYSYAWNSEQTDATLVEAEGRDIRLNLRDRSVPGGRRQQDWRIPSRNECMFCHSRAAAFVLGLRTPQMNRDYRYGQVVDNQLRTLNHIGLFSNPLKKSPSEFDAFPDPYDAQADRNQRARAYLHVNCSICHVSDGGGNARFEARFFQTLAQTKLTDRPMHGDFGLNDARLVTPGDPYASVLYYRLAKWGRGRMPHIGSNLHDERALRLIHDWIAGLPSEAPPAPENPAKAPPERVLAALRKGAGRPPNKRGPALARLLGSTRSALIVATHAARLSPKSPLRQQLTAAGMSHPDAAVRDLFERFLPLEKRTRRLGNRIDVALILRLRGDRKRGRQFFFASTASQCKNCHRVDKQGGALGPDLSSIGRKYKPAEILESLIDPSRKVDPKFQTVQVATADGKVHSGVLSRKTETELTLQTFRSGKVEVVRIARADVEQLRTQKQSLMPDGLLRDLTAQQAADLVAFLGSLRAPDASTKQDGSR